MARPCYITVDVEAAGPNPSDYSLLSIGAATVSEPRHSFYVELQPINQAETAAAAKVHGLSLPQLAQDGIEPSEALKRFEAWVQEMLGADESPVFVAFNAPFDWMFINDYFQRFLGRNPFGHRALDIKALFMGMHGVAWEDTTHQAISSYYNLPDSLPHQAEEDALQEAELFAAMLVELRDAKSEILKENHT